MTTPELDRNGTPLVRARQVATGHHVTIPAAMQAQWPDDYVILPGHRAVVHGLPVPDKHSQPIPTTTAKAAKAAITKAEEATA